MFRREKRPSLLHMFVLPDKNAVLKQTKRTRKRWQRMIHISKSVNIPAVTGLRNIKLGRFAISTAGFYRALLGDSMHWGGLLTRAPISFTVKFTNGRMNVIKVGTNTKLKRQRGKGNGVVSKHAKKFRR